MNWLSNILSLVAIIAAGIHQIHTDKTLDQKQAIGQDLLTTAMAGASVLLPPAEAGLATGIGTVAQNTLAETIAVLHNTPTLASPPVADPVPAPAA